MKEQIWVIRGSQPVLWTVPYRARWIGNRLELSRVLPPLFAHQERAIADFFNDRGGCQMTPRELKLIADPLPYGVTPEESFSWERPRFIRQFEPNKRRERNEFLDSAYQRGLGQSRDEVEYWWSQFCNAMLDWLINKEKPVDLYFAKIHPTPLRMDWRARLAREKRLTLAELIEGGFLYALDTKGVCRRYLELEQTQTWTQTTIKVEKRRLKMLRRAGYAKAIIGSGQRAIEAAARSLSQRAFDSKAKSVFFLPGGLGGTNGMAPNLRHRKLGKKKSELRRLARKIVFQPRLPARRPVRKKKQHVPKLRVVQPPPPNVWNGRGYVPPSIGRKETLARVLVLLADQKRHAEQLLALQSKPGDTRLAERVKHLAG